MILLRMRNKKKLVLCVKLLFVFCAMAFFVVVMLYMQIEDEILLSKLFDIDKCPACYGLAECPDIVNRTSFRGLDKLQMMFPILKLKNVYSATYRDKKYSQNHKNVVLKKLAHNEELTKFDSSLKKSICGEELCNVEKAMVLKWSEKNPLNLLKGKSDLTHCPTQRLMQLMYDTFLNKKSSVLSDKEKIMLYTTIMINPEPVILQMFPATDGWPFPEIYGACGRVVVEDDRGLTLDNYHYASWETRVAIAYEIFHIADMLTNRSKTFALYWTDLNYDNFVVNEEGKVSIIDAENIVVIDKQWIRTEKPEKWDIPYASQFDDCENNCLSFNIESLCNRITVDHNYYAACRNLLSSYAQIPGYPGGFLHDIPPEINKEWNLEFLLNECSKPSEPAGRFVIKDKLLNALTNATLRQR